MSRFPLNEGVDPFCQGHWDGNKFVPSSPAEVIQCCLRSCEDHPNFCFNLCDQLYKNDGHNRKICYQQCNELATDCSDACYSIPSEGLKIVNECAKDCKDIACIEKSKDQIVNCCYRECSGSQSLDCNNRCDMLYDMLVKKNSVITVPIHKETEQEYNSHTSRLPIILLVLLVLFAVILLLR